MTINYLILAHNHFDHLSRLIRAIDDNGVHIYVHIDKKQRRNYSNTAVNVHVVEERIRVNWGCYSMIEATLLLMRQAALSTPADRYVLLSGADYPIRSNHDIRQVLSASREYIDMRQVPFPRKPMSRFIFYHLEYNRKKKNVAWFFFRSLEEIMRQLRIKRAVPFNIYAGSQWFALTGKCVQHILELLNVNHSYTHFFRYAKIPDEAFFQTIIGNSPFKDQVGDSLTYTHWEKKYSPLYITEEHLKVFDGMVRQPSKQPKVFARKFDDRNRFLLPVIDREFRNNNFVTAYPV